MNVKCPKCQQMIVVTDEIVSLGRAFFCNNCGCKLQFKTKTKSAPPAIPVPPTLPASPVPPVPPLPSSSLGDVKPSGVKISISADEMGTSAPQRLSPRQRRLAADQTDTLNFFRGFPLIRILEYKGNPADCYTVEYLIRGIERVEYDRPVYRNQHVVEIRLDGTYPRTPPHCRMLTPIFHPNIEPAVICIGDHWTAQERLSHLIVRIGEIIAYQSYNIHSPLDGLAAKWADLHEQYLPVDSRFLMPDTQ